MNVRSMSSQPTNEKLWSEEPEQLSRANGGVGGARPSADGSVQAPQNGAEGAGGAPGTPPKTSARGLPDCAAEMVGAAVTCRDATAGKRLDKVVACGVAVDRAVSCLVEQYSSK